MRYNIPLAVTCLLVVSGYVYFGQPSSDGGLEVKYRYLLVDVVGPPEWQKNHSFSVRWQGKDLSLPVVFRVAGVAENIEMGSGGEIFGHLLIGKEKAPVSAKPDTKFQVRNTGVIAFIGEKSSKKDTVAFSIATFVAMSPPEHPGELSPIAKDGERDSAGKKLEKRVKQVIAAGSVVEVQPAK
jgi:hypothetical protein